LLSASSLGMRSSAGHAERRARPAHQPADNAARREAVADPPSQTAPGGADRCHHRVQREPWGLNAVLPLSLACLEAWPRFLRNWAFGWPPLHMRSTSPIPRLTEPMPVPGHWLGRGQYFPTDAEQRQPRCDPQRTSGTRSKPLYWVSCAQPGSPSTLTWAIPISAVRDTHVCAETTTSLQIDWRLGAEAPRLPHALSRWRPGGLEPRQTR